MHAPPLLIMCPFLHLGKQSGKDVIVRVKAWDPGCGNTDVIKAVAGRQGELDEGKDRGGRSRLKISLGRDLHAVLKHAPVGWRVRTVASMWELWNFRMVVLRELWEPVFSLFSKFQDSLR